MWSIVKLFKILSNAKKTDLVPEIGAKRLAPTKYLIAPDVETVRFRALCGNAPVIDQYCQICWKIKVFVNFVTSHFDVI